eukprot:TRINITY_DN30150_c0_g1_i1.p2 TRINITY_DN30150_c0_g1~~TRINITY_DN30150_c0_g1_i1.p2  ORF type:complete len:188 (+),score=86.13 TRINITY_DN30150_c0_g1_i1:47-565(+)
MADEGEKVRVQPMPEPHSSSPGAPRKAAGHVYRLHVWQRRTLRFAGVSAIAGLVYWRIPDSPQKRQLVKDSVNEYMSRRHDLRGIVDLEIYDELEAIGKYQRRKRWMGEPVPVVNQAAVELGFDHERYPWNYDRKPPDCWRYHPSMMWYRFQRKYYYTPEQIKDIDSIYGLN